TEDISVVLWMPDDLLYRPPSFLSHVRSIFFGVVQEPGLVLAVYGELVGDPVWSSGQPDPDHILVPGGGRAVLPAVAISFQICEGVEPEDDHWNHVVPICVGEGAGEGPEP